VTAGSTSGSIPRLFPFTDAYAVYAGSCTDADPSKYGGAVGTATVPPGGTGTVAGALHLPPISATVTRNGSAFGVANVKITSTVAGCADSATVTTNASGKATVAMPYGHYTVCADDQGSPAYFVKVAANNITAGGASAAPNIVPSAATKGSC
jgi:hypothetical protein